MYHGLAAVAAANTEAGIAQAAAIEAMLNSFDDETVAPLAGLSIRTERVVSAPDGNTINIQFIRPDNAARVPCVYYIHGGGMTIASCYYGNYRAWGRIIAANGVAVAMVDFRNALVPSSVPEVAPFPAGLNDCVSGLKWVHANSATLNIDPARIIVAGESGGGNLTLATGLKLKRDGDLGLLKGLYALCPYSRGNGPSRNIHPQSKTTGFCSTFTIIVAPWVTESTPSVIETRSPGLRSPPQNTSQGSRPP
jgi:acetyl esterase